MKAIFSTTFCLFLYTKVLTVNFAKVATLHLIVQVKLMSLLVLVLDMHKILSNKQSIATTHKLTCVVIIKNVDILN